MRRIIHYHWERRSKAFWLPLVGFLLVLATVITVMDYIPRQAVHASATDWPTFLGNNARTDYNAAETTINPTTAPHLKIHWRAFTAAHALITTQVIEANSVLYWGSWDGVMHATDPNTGQSLWTTSLSTTPGGCSKKPNATDLSFVASWQVPRSDMVGQDDDFGSTPTLFSATINGVAHAMLGIVNKDGYYYALDRNNISAGPLWKVRMSVGGAAPAKNASIPSAAYDGTYLYTAGSGTTIGGQSCPGSLQKLDPNSGAVLWADCLPAAVLAPVFGVPGLVVVGAGNSMDVVDANTGQILFTYQDTVTSGGFWGAAMISKAVLFEGSKSGTLFAFGL